MLPKILKLIALTWVGVLVTGIVVIAAQYVVGPAVRAIRSRLARRH